MDPGITRTHTLAPQAPLALPTHFAPSLVLVPRPVASYHMVASGFCTSCPSVWVAYPCHPLTQWLLCALRDYLGFFITCFANSLSSSECEGHVGGNCLSCSPSCPRLRTAHGG